MPYHKITTLTKLPCASIHQNICIFDQSHAILYKERSSFSSGDAMKKIIAAIALLLLASSVAAAGTVPRVRIQHPNQARIFLHPPICETILLPSIPNRGVIYAQVLVFNADSLYIEFNGQPVRDEFGNIIYNPKPNPEYLEIIPIYIADHFQYEACYIMANAVNQYGAHAVYAAFVPVPTGRGSQGSAFGCTTMY